jgi:hypothetical protein
MVGETYVLACMSKVNKYTLAFGECEGAYILVG